MIESFDKNLDEKDRAILKDREILLNQIAGPRVGDFIQFSDELRRIAHVWKSDQTVQTTNAGSFYLGEGYVEMSGRLYRGIPIESLRLTNDQRPGHVWFFHHNDVAPNNGIGTVMNFRVYQCDIVAPTY